MPCLLVILSLLLPRLALVLIFLFTTWFHAVFAGWVLPLLGFIFLPYTTLAYMGATLKAGAVSPLWLVLIILAVLVDIAHWGGGYSQRRRRRRRRRR
ncbi:MAG: hypothetical protein BWX88_04803 [Planctomycetes bacterium ADurb.Bin126]|nr:MAG: hypothetical protein BWX88_04803 [Planctomycetes bacterium ADurb.Bin126]HOD81980.1 hypothetical protein [Phycisphaerae bacterium]HQL74272.1 hypothetical protein [Phycisphaerae bacterium]